MRRRVAVGVTALTVLAVAIWAAQAVNLTGTWKLNVAKSKWNQKQKPVSLVIEIAHQEPALKYSGLVVDVHGDGREFHFSGSIGGKEYPISGPYGEGKLSIKRLDANTTIAVFRSNDGHVTETSRTSISRDGKVLTQQVHLKDPNGELAWTEIYEKQR